MSAPAVHVPSPRRPVGSTAPGAASDSAHHIPAPRVPAPHRAPRRETTGRHHLAVQPCSPAARTFTVLARAGSLTTLAAMVVLAAAVAGLADGNPPTGAAADVAVSDLDR